MQGQLLMFETHCFAVPFAPEAMNCSSTTQQWARCGLRMSNSIACIFDGNYAVLCYMWS